MFAMAVKPMESGASATSVQSALTTIYAGNVKPMELILNTLCSRSVALLTLLRRSSVNTSTSMPLMKLSRSLNSLSVSPPKFKLLKCLKLRRSNLSTLPSLPKYRPKRPNLMWLSVLLFLDSHPLKS